MDTVIDESAKCCLFCLRLFSQEEGNDRDLGKSQQFLKLLKRYLLNQYDSDSTIISTGWIRSLQSAFISSSNGSVENAMAPCMDCSGIINSFCEYYEEIRILEMKLQWRLQTLTNIVESSEKVKLRQKFFQVRLEQVKELDGDLDVVDLMKRVKYFRTELVKICSRKFLSSFPRVSLRRCDSNSIPGKYTKKASKRSNENVPVNNKKVKRWRLQLGRGPVPAPLTGSGVIGELLNEVFQPSEPSITTENRDVEQLQLFIKTETPSLTESTSMSEVSTFEEDYQDNDEHSQVKCSDNPSNSGIEGSGEESISFGNEAEIIGFRKTDNATQCQKRKVSRSEMMRRKRNMSAKLREQEDQQDGLGGRLSLRQRFRCKKCWRNFCSEEKLQNHFLERCDDGDNDYGSDVKQDKIFKVPSQSSEDSDFENTLSDEITDASSDDEDEETLAAEERYKHKDSSRPYKNYDFMKTLFKCPEDNCSSFFYNQTDLDNHSKLHGIFQCSSCESNFSYAPDLALHELQHALSSSTRDIISCPRKNCFYIVHQNKLHHVFVAHFLRAHLELSPNLHTCPVCMATVTADDGKRSKNWMIYTGSWKISNHFKVHHDYDFNGVSQDALFRCDVPTCPAYFLQETQLQHHKRVVHSSEKDGIKPSKLITCKLCPSPGGQFTRLALDRHNKDYHGDKFGVVCKIKGCKRRFRRTRNLKVHIARDHGKNKDDAEVPSEREGSDNSNGGMDDDVCGGKEETVKNQKRKKVLRTKCVRFEDYDFMKIKLKCPVENCNSFFYNQSDLDNHSKCHGIFKCSICSTTMPYAPDLARHELQHVHDVEGEDNKTKTCPRDNCLYSIHKGKFENYDISHFLQAHLQLIPNVHTCPVCSITIPADDSYRNQHYRGYRWVVSGSSKLSEHYRANHDLNGVSDDSVVIHCDFPKCKAYFLKETQLRRHKKIVHHTEKEFAGELENEEEAEEEIICKLCKEHFKTKEALHHHQVVQHRSKYGHSCDVTGCNRKFRWARSKRLHMKRDHGDRAFACSISTCTKTFPRKDQLLFHQNQVHRKIQLDADTSTSTTDPPVDQEPGPDQVFQCSVTSCAEAFFNQENLQGHMKLHGIFKCQFCDETYNYAPDLALHELSSHKIEGRVKNASGEVFSCPRCTFRDICTEPQYVQHHLKFHLDVEMVVKNMCSVCKFVFKDDSFSPKIFALHYKKQHDLSVNGNESGNVFRCEEDNCGGAYFLRADQFNLHNLIVHNKKEKRLECLKCGKLVLTSNHLKKHNLRFHVPKEEWKHVCDECGKKCVNSYDLRSHKLSHVSEKSYACEHCGSMYKSRDKFKKHLKKLHGVMASF